MQKAMWGQDQGNISGQSLANMEELTKENRLPPEPVKFHSTYPIIPNSGTRNSFTPFKDKWVKRPQLWWWSDALLPKTDKEPQKGESGGQRRRPPPQTHLVDDVDAVVQLLPLQEGVKVLQQVQQVLLPMPVRDEDGNPLQSPALFRAIPASVHLGVLCLDFLQSEIWLEHELGLAFYNKHRAQELTGQAYHMLMGLQEPVHAAHFEHCLAHHKHYCKASFGHKI